MMKLNVKIWVQMKEQRVIVWVTRGRSQERRREYSNDRRSRWDAGKENNLRECSLLPNRYESSLEIVQTRDVPRFNSTQMASHDHIQSRITSEPIVDWIVCPT